MNPGCGWKVSPRCSANSPGVGWRNTAVGVITTGRSRGRKPMPASITSKSSSSSTSTHVCGTRDRAANARNAIASAENCEPTIRTARAPSPMRRRSRRAKKAEKITSATSGLTAMTRRNSSTGITRMRPACRTRPVRNRRCRVSMFSSPRNWPAPQVARMDSPSRSGRTMSTSPSRTTMKSYDVSPARNRMSPASTARSSPNGASSASAAALRTGAAASGVGNAGFGSATRSKLAKATRRGSPGRGQDRGSGPGSGSIGTDRCCSRPIRRARVTAPAPNRDRTSSSARSSAGSR